MPHRESNQSDENISRKGRKPRTKSASEIARDVPSFEVWSTYQGCQDVAYQDIPKCLRADVTSVFDVVGLLPKEWLSEKTETGMALGALMPSGFVQFLKTAHKAAPTLFSSSVKASDCKAMLFGLQAVYLAWTRLRKMRKSSRKWSEADYTANVYNPLRSAAVVDSDYRAQCSIALAQPLPRHKVTNSAVRILNAKAASPDVSIFIPSRLVLDLSLTAESPYKALKAHLSKRRSGSIGDESSFRFQSTPCTKLLDAPGFEFVSTVCEDKKPVHHLIHDAYRQNRLSTTSAVRQLHALHIQAPVFGLVWMESTVRAHIDWWTVPPNAEYPIIRSAPYPGSANTGRRGTLQFHDWSLDRPHEILQVFLFMRNLDTWTVGRFTELIHEGIAHLVEDVVKRGHVFKPWKKRGDIARMISQAERTSDVTVNTSDGVTPVSSPPRRKSKRRVAS